MTRDELWAIYCDKNPLIPRDEIRMWSDSFKKFFDVTWEKAHEAGFENGKAWAEMRAREKHGRDTMDIFRDVFTK